MTCQSATLLNGALGHLLRYKQQGCVQSARHAAYLLDRLLHQAGIGEEGRGLCLRLREMLGEVPALKLQQGVWRNSAHESAIWPGLQELAA